MVKYELHGNKQNGLLAFSIPFVFFSLHAHYFASSPFFSLAFIFPLSVNVFFTPLAFHSLFSHIYAER